MKKAKGEHEYDKKAEETLFYAACCQHDHESSECCRFC